MRPELRILKQYALLSPQVCRAITLLLNYGVLFCLFSSLGKREEVRRARYPRAENCHRRTFLISLAFEHRAKSTPGAWLFTFYDGNCLISVSYSS